MKYIKLFEEYDSTKINSPYANDEEMKEIEKVKKYFKWWYSDPKVISKLNVKGDKNSVANRIVEYIDKKLVPSEFRIFRNEEDAKKYLKIAYNDENFNKSAFGWVFDSKEPIFIRLHNIKYSGRQLFGTVLHEVSHLIQMFASEELKVELYNPTMPKGAYGINSIKSGLFLPPLNPNHEDKPYAEQEIEQFARFQVMRYYFGIKPNDNCNEICEKIKKNIKNGNNTLYLMERENGKKYLFYKTKNNPKNLNDNLFWYMRSLGFKTLLTDKHFKHKGWNDMELRKLSEFTYLLDLDTICHDHQNIVSNLDIDEKNLA